MLNNINLSDSDALNAAKSESKERLTSLRVTLGKLDELSDVMLDMLDQQQGVEVSHRLNEMNIVIYLRLRQIMRLTWRHCNHISLRWNTST